jgi:hypothetical protein
MGIVAFAFLACVPQVDQNKINEAIDQGAQYLLTAGAKGFDKKVWDSPLELAVLALAHSKVKADEPAYVKAVEDLLAAPLSHTYRVAVHAMALSRLDPAKHRERIAHCAQWLVDTQTSSGAWGYPGNLADATSRPAAVTIAAPRISDPAKIKVRRVAPIDPKAEGDFSATQFALLGLRACADAGIEIQKETWYAALQYTLKTRRQDGGWGYQFGRMKDKTSYGSMTCAGVAGVAICQYYLNNKNFAKDGAVLAGLAWLGKGYDPSDHVNVTLSGVIDPTRWHYYYLYSIERVGDILKVDKLGTHDWYAEGAKYLLEQQKPDGSWTVAGARKWDWTAVGDMQVADTCFAILFLTKATPTLIQTPGSKKPATAPGGVPDK